MTSWHHQAKPAAVFHRRGGFVPCLVEADDWTHGKFHEKDPMGRRDVERCEVTVYHHRLISSVFFSLFEFRFIHYLAQIFHLLRLDVLPTLHSK